MARSAEAQRGIVVTLSLLGAKTLTVTRYAPGVFVDGDWSQSVDSTFEIVGTLRPLSEKDKQLLPEGTRATEIRKLYTDPANVLQLAIEAQGIKSDRVTDGVDTWEVTGVADNTDHTGGLAHWRYELTRVELTEP